MKKENAFASHKYAGKSALRYELGGDILVGNLVWIQAPESALPVSIPTLNSSTKSSCTSLSWVSGSRPRRGHRGHAYNK
jgi:hypothetical protein